MGDLREVARRPRREDAEVGQLGARFGEVPLVDSREREVHAYERRESVGGEARDEVHELGEERDALLGVGRPGVTDGRKGRRRPGRRRHADDRSRQPGPSPARAGGHGTPGEGGRGGRPQRASNGGRARETRKNRRISSGSCSSLSLTHLTHSPKPLESSRMGKKPTLPKQATMPRDDRLRRLFLLSGARPSRPLRRGSSWSPRRRRCPAPGGSTASLRITR